MTTDNVIDFVERKNKQEENISDIPEDDLIAHCEEISQDLMNDLLTNMANDYDFGEDYFTETPQLLFVFESIKSFIWATYGLSHPLQEVANELIKLEYIGEEPIFYDDEPPNDN